MLGRSWLWFASRDQVGTRPANGILDNVREQRAQEEADEEAKDRDMCLVQTWSEYQGPHDDEYQRSYSCVYDVFQVRYPLNKRMGILLCVVVKGEHAMKWLDEELCLLHL